MIVAKEARRLSETSYGWRLGQLPEIEEYIVQSAKGGSRFYEVCYRFSFDLKKELKERGFSISEYVNPVGNLITKISW